MVVPDFELICEIMLVAEGFLEARLLARKFITLYTLCKELLSKQVGAGGVLGPWGWGARGCNGRAWRAVPASQRQAHTTPSARRTITTGACAPSSRCWWWPAP